MTMVRIRNASFLVGMTMLLLMLSDSIVHGFIPSNSRKPTSFAAVGRQEELLRRQNKYHMAVAPSGLDETDIEEDTTLNLEEKLDMESLISSSPSKKFKGSRRKRFLNKIGFKRMQKDQAEIRDAEKNTHTPDTIYNITTVEELNEYFEDKEKRFRNDKGEIDYDVLLRALNVQGDTQIIGSPDHPEYIHPVAQLLHERRKSNSKAVKIGSTRSDGCRVALAIEGGGMRGCVSAGAVGALHYLNLTDTFDVVYGSSAGSIIGSYFLTRQLPWFGPELYYDCLTTAKRGFIDTRRVLRALGFGILDPRLTKDVLTRPEEGKPVLNLSFLLKRTMQETKPLDWDKFVKINQYQPLKVVASGLKSKEAVVMSMENGSFRTLEELSDCMHASCLLPGIAGPMMNLNRTAVKTNSGQKFVLGNRINSDDMEPLADALLYEPLPFRSAVKEGATHVVTIRSRPDGKDVTGRGGFVERLIFRRFLLRKNRLPSIFKHLKNQIHKKVYGEAVLELNADANSTRLYNDTSAPHHLTIALPPGSDEVGKLETGREAIFMGLRRGFARAYDALVEDPSERGKGAEVAKVVFPDEILDYDPLSIDATTESAFEAYMRQENIVPRIWQDQNQFI